MNQRKAAVAAMVEEHGVPSYLASRKVDKGFTTATGYFARSGTRYDFAGADDKVLALTLPDVRILAQEYDVYIPEGILPKRTSRYTLYDVAQENKELTLRDLA